MSTCTKPIYPVLPSLINAEKEIKQFLSGNRVNFPDEVNLGKALAHVFTSTKYRFEKTTLPEMDIVSIRSIINTAQNGYLDAQTNQELLVAAGILLAEQLIISDKSQLGNIKSKIKFPVAMKVIGPVHKTEVNGVMLNINDIEQTVKAFEKLITIPDASAVLVQEMVKGEELYCGAVRQGDFGHVVLCGLGGVFWNYFRTQLLHWHQCLMAK